MTFAMGLPTPQYKAVLGSPPTDPNTNHTQKKKKRKEKSVREKREREKKKSGGGVLQGKGLFPSSVWDLWWNRAAQGAGLLINRSKVKRRGS